MDLIKQLNDFIAAFRAGNVVLAIQLALAILSELANAIPAVPNVRTKTKYAALQAGSADLDFLANEIESHVLTAQGDAQKLPIDQLVALLMAAILKLLGLS